MKKGLLITAICIVVGSAMAHEFWLQPTHFYLRPNDASISNIFVGEDYTGSRVDGRKYKSFQLWHHSAMGKEDYKANVIDTDMARIKTSFATAGNHLLAFNNTNKFITLEPKKFNDYLRSEGLDNIYAIRQRNGDTTKPGKEYYQRCVKTLLKVGDKLDDTYATNTGMKLELIPTQNPYGIQTAAAITFKVLFDNQPYTNALVLAWQTLDGKTTHTSIRSNEQGEATFQINAKGRWMISTVKMVPSTEMKEADWQSYWGSYTFGYY